MCFQSLLVLLRTRSSCEHETKFKFFPDNSNGLPLFRSEFVLHPVLDCELSPLFLQEIRSRIEPREMRERRKVGRGQKKARGGGRQRPRRFFNMGCLSISFSASPLPLSLFFLSSPHFSRALSSLEARFSTISWRKRGDYSQSTRPSK